MQSHHLGWDLTLTSKLMDGLQRIEATDSRLDQLMVPLQTVFDELPEGAIVLHPLRQPQWSRRH